MGGSCSELWPRVQDSHGKALYLQVPLICLERSLKCFKMTPSGRGPTTVLTSLPEPGSLRSARSRLPPTAVCVPQDTGISVLGRQVPASLLGGHPDVPSRSWSHSPPCSLLSTQAPRLLSTWEALLPLTLAAQARCMSEKGCQLSLWNARLLKGHPCPFPAREACRPPAPSHLGTPTPAGSLS